MSIVNCLDISQDNQAMGNFMNAELGIGNTSSAIAHNSKFELTDIIEPERHPLDILSD